VSYGDVALGVECAFPRAFSKKENVRKKAAIWIVALLAVAGALQFGQGLYIHAKAELAQVLLERAWQRTLAGEQAVKPWPWADTWPVARLIAPAQRTDLLVLAGANGRTIAFGPGHMDGTPLPGAKGNSVIGGHRDTHLAFLRTVKRGETLTVERADGRRTDYRVTDLDVLDKRDTWVAKNEGPSRLTLITCWPFDALRAGGPERYVVIARRI
jgi:sortase A